VKDSVIAFALLVVAIIHLIPLSGVLGEARLFSLYGLHFSDNNELILMQHRAVLFGLLGSYMLFAIVVVSQRIYALISGLVSVISFLLIAFIVGDYKYSLLRVMWVDGVALSLLLLALTLTRFESHP
jgi:hypothetical protein